MPKKPNILFLFTDDQRFDTINALGNPHIHTPNLDQLVKGGFSFQQAHIPGGTVGAVCMPSRAMIHTGRFLFSLQDEGEEIPEEHVTLGEVLQENGYRTFGTGKWHNGIPAFARSFTDGDEIFFGGMWDHWNVPANHFDPEGKYEQVAPFINNFYYGNQTQEMRCDHLTPGAHSTDLIAGAALDFLRKYTDDDPWFAYVSFMAPHDPRSMPKGFLEMYSADEVELPPNFAAEHAFDFGIRAVRDEVLEEYPRTKDKIKKHIAEYYAMITHLDAAIGRIIAQLRERGEYEDTIIVFAGDNGLSLGQHGLMGKQNVYEHSLRVPLIFAGQDIPRDVCSEEYVYLMDIYPTLLDLLGIEVPSSSEAQSLLPLMCDGASGRGQLYLAFRELTRAVKSDGFKLAEYMTPDSIQTQLFDLRNDPWEQNNLAQLPEYDEKVKNLREDLFRLRDQNGDLRHPRGKEFWEFYKRNCG